jgi:hypothetical protein
MAINAQTVFIGSFLLFIVLTPGVIFTMPGKSETVEVNSGQTNPRAVLVAALLYATVLTLAMVSGYGPPQG